MAQVYRFFPWVRRGLAAALPAAQVMPLRATATFQVKVTVSPDIVTGIAEDPISVSRGALLLGPGDIAGIDRQLILRTDPRPHAVDVEPNYLPAIEFDPPDFPWMFTPAAAGANQQLAPWLVLIVLDAEKVAAPFVAPGRPLPSIHLDAATAQQELPKLSESWAWAHAQRMATAGEGDDAVALQGAPDRNLSRLVCPRRLQPDKRYLACVVPAFDAGRDAGLARARQVPDAPLGPAWPDAIAGDVTLPVYHHWEFQTGTAGDFESLARRLSPQRILPSAQNVEGAPLGRVWLGAVDGAPDTAAALPPDDPKAAIRIEAPLEAMGEPMAQAADTPSAFATAMARATRPAPEDATAPVLRPPVYGDRHAGRDVLSPDQIAANWLEELNLDPRMRVAARLGGDTVRRFQEDLMHVAWEQVGDVMAANDQLARSRFLALTAERALVRHTANLSAARLMMLTSVMHRRVLADTVTIAGRIARTSLADRAFDAGLRRLTTPVGRVARLAARVSLAGRRVLAEPALAQGLAAALQRDNQAVDPAQRPRDGIGVYAPAVRAAAEGWDRLLLAEGAAESIAVADLVATPDTRLTFRPRDDLAASGILTAMHHKAAADIARQTGAAADHILSLAMQTMRHAPDALHLTVTIPDDRPHTLSISAVVQDRGNRFALVDATGVRAPLLRLDGAEDIATGPASGLETALRILPAGTDGAEISMAARAGAVGTEWSFAATAAGLSQLARNREEGPAEGRGFDLDLVTTTRSRSWLATDVVAANVQTPRFAAIMPPLVTSRAATSAVEATFLALDTAMPDIAAPTLVLATLGSNADAGLAGTIRQAMDPANLFRRRAAVLVTVPGWINRAGQDSLDPIAAAPMLDMAFCDLLARAAPRHVLPPEVTLAEDSIAALQTNPRFVAAFMVGANHEMNRELMWRTFPTDARGTPITRFWNWHDPARKDVARIHAWPGAGPLTSLLAQGAAQQVAMVLRGRLLRRYPNTHVLLWKASNLTTLAPVPDDQAGAAAILRQPLFRLLIDPDLTVAGFDLTPAAFLADAGWFIVLQEPITEARFGLDETGDAPALRSRRNANDLNWDGAGVVPGGHLTPAGLDLQAGQRHAAAAAERMLQRPVRFAIHSSELAAIFGAGG